MSRRQNQWTARDLARVQREVKTSLDAIEQSEGAGARLLEIITQVETLESDLSKEGTIRRYVYCLSALAHHLRKGGLKLGQATRLAEVAKALLQLQGITISGKVLSRLHGEIHTALSQLYRMEGETLLAAWEQQLALYAMGNSVGYTLAVQQLAQGMRASRIGNVAGAITYLTRAERNGLDENRLAIARIERVRCLRLSGQVEQARALAEESFKGLALPPDSRKEMQWELLCMEAMVSRNPNCLFLAAGRKGTHHGAIYIVEAFLWTRMVSSKSWLVRFPTIGSLAWGMKGELKSLGSIYKFTEILKILYDQKRPLFQRLQLIKEVIPLVAQVRTIEKELQIWACLARWASRHHAKEISAFFISQYKGLSLRVTDGASADALGCAGDLLQIDLKDDRVESDLKNLLAA